MLKLYHGLTSVCSVKVRIGLAEIGLEYESHVLDLPKGDQHHPDYLKINPDAVVPTLIDDGLVLYESSLILEYLDREYNDGNLMPDGKAEEAGARLWLLRCLSVHDAVNSLSFSTAHRDRTLASKTPDQIGAMLANMPDPVKRMKRKDLLDNGLASIFVQQALLNLDRIFSDMNSTLSSNAWMSGTDFGITDIALVSYIDRLQKLGFEGLWMEDQPGIGDWLDKMQSRPSFTAEVTEKIDPSVLEKMKFEGSQHWPELERQWSKLTSQ